MYTVDSSIRGYHCLDVCALIIHRPNARHYCLFSPSYSPRSLGHMLNCSDDVLLQNILETVILFSDGKKMSTKSYSHPVWLDQTSSSLVQVLPLLVIPFTNFQSERYQHISETACTFSSKQHIYSFHPPAHPSLPYRNVTNTISIA